MTKSIQLPSFLHMYREGILQDRIEAARERLACCTLCPHECGVNRLMGETGICRTGSRARGASYGPHFGEESPLVGTNGSGTIFFEGCNLLCVFCQNHDISHLDPKEDTSREGMTSSQLAVVMLALQEQGCHNINLVTPSHVVPQILAALPQAIEGGLRVPLVYNSSGYDSAETLRLLDGVVDIYMPDCKFWTSHSAKRYTTAPDYPAVMQDAVREMHRQVGDLVVGESGLARRGLLVRHLVMPDLPEESRGVLSFLTKQISPQTYVNIMDQYRPCHRAGEFPEINRSLHRDEHEKAVTLAEKLGLERLDQRDWKRLLNLLGL